MAELETITGDNWQEFTDSPLAVLVIGKTDCEKCAEWSQELIAFLAETSDFDSVRFGKLMLDTRGLSDFKKANAWLAELTALPHNVIYQAGERVKDYAGGGATRLENRLKRIMGS